MIYIIILIIVLIIASAITYISIPYSPLKSSFNKEMQERTKQTINSAGNSSFEYKDIYSLSIPEPIKRYYQYIKINSWKNNSVVNAVFKDTDFVMDSKTGQIINMDYDLWLFFDKPYRQAYCYSKIGPIPFEGIDYCTVNKTGGMKGVLAKSIKIFDECNEQGYKAALLSWLAEGAAFNPYVFVSDYVCCEQIDDLRVKATVNYDGVSASGIFTFNMEGQITQFYSDERQVELVNGELIHIGWRCDYLGYSDGATESGYDQTTSKDDAKHITHVSCVKVYTDHQLTYFDSENINLTYYGSK